MQPNNRSVLTYDGAKRGLLLPFEGSLRQTLSKRGNKLFVIFAKPDKTIILCTLPLRSVAAPISHVLEKKF